MDHHATTSAPAIAPTRIQQILLITALHFLLRPQLESLQRLAAVGECS